MKKLLLALFMISSFAHAKSSYFFFVADPAFKILQKNLYLDCSLNIEKFVRSILYENSREIDRACIDIGTSFQYDYAAVGYNYSIKGRYGVCLKEFDNSSKEEQELLIQQAVNAFKELIQSDFCSTSGDKDVDNKLTVYCHIHNIKSSPIEDHDDSRLLFYTGCMIFLFL